MYLEKKSGNLVQIVQRLGSLQTFNSFLSFRVFSFFYQLCLFSHVPFFSHATHVCKTVPHTPGKNQVEMFTKQLSPIMGLEKIQLQMLFTCNQRKQVNVENVWGLINAIMKASNWSGRKPVYVVIYRFNVKKILELCDAC